MNIIDIQDRLKDFSEQQLVSEMQRPSGMAPQFLVLSEIQRRKRVRDDFTRQEAAQQMTVAQEAVASAGVPQAGIAGMSEAMAPKSSMAQSGIGAVMKQPMKMSDGGVIKANDGLPLGLRQNNPGNIRPGGGFFGETDAANGYASFETEQLGLRALARLLNTYGTKYNINTIEDLVERYAPPSDNPDSYQNYIDFLSEELGVGADEEFDLVSRREDLIPAIVAFEQGRDYGDRYSDAQVNAAVMRSNLTDDQLRLLESASMSNDNPAMIGLDDRFTSNIGGDIETIPITPDGGPLIPPLLQGKDGEPISKGQSGQAEEGTPEADDPTKITVDPSTGAVVPEGEEIDPEDIPTILEILPTIPEIFSGDEEEEEEEPEAPVTPTTTVEVGGDKPTYNVSALEQQILDMEAELKKSRDQDKWLAIAQAGLAIMESDSPTLAGAIGEGGISGLTAFREAQERYEEGVIDLINARAKLKGDGTAVKAKEILDANIKILDNAMATPEERARARMIIDNIMSGSGYGLVQIPQQPQT